MIANFKGAYKNITESLLYFWVTRDIIYCIQKNTKKQ